MCARLRKRSGIPNSFNVWLCCIRFMRSTHEQTIRCQNKCSYPSCVSWDVCTEISLMVISLGKHVDILEALSSSVSLLYLFFGKFQYIVNSSIRVVESPSSAGCNMLRSRVCARAIGSSRSAMCVFVRCLAPQLRGCRASVAPFCQSAATDKVLASRREAIPHQPSLCISRTTRPPRSNYLSDLSFNTLAILLALQ